MLFDTQAREVFTLVKIKASHNYMSEPLAIMTARDAKLTTFKTACGSLMLNFMLYTSGRATVRQVELPAGLLSSLRWRS